jgi:hypothetical protein
MKSQNLNLQLHLTKKSKTTKKSKIAKDHSKNGTGSWRSEGIWPRQQVNDCWNYTKIWRPNKVLHIQSIARGVDINLCPHIVHH